MHFSGDQEDLGVDIMVGSFAWRAIGSGMESEKEFKESLALSS